MVVRLKGQILFFTSICQIFLCTVLFKSLAVSLHCIPYRDSSVIARFFTEEYGLQSFIASGVRSSKSRISPGLFQQLSQVELVHYLNPGKDLHRLSEIRPVVHNSFSLSPPKSAIAMFAAEYLSRVLKEHLESKPLFHFVWNWIRELDKRDLNFESAHLGLVWHSFSALGIAPENWQDLFTGASGPREEEFPVLDAFFSDEDAFAILKVASHRRQFFLDALIRHASTQMEGMGEIKTLSVLRQVFA